MKTLIHYLSYLLKYKITVNLSCANFVVNSLIFVEYTIVCVHKKLLNVSGDL